MKPTSLPTPSATLRSSLSFLHAILTMVLLASAGRALAGPQIAIEQPVGTALSRGVAAWGTNDFGQTNVPAELKDVQTVATGVEHSVALKTDGTVVAWGRNDFGQGSVPDGLNNVRVLKAGYYHNVALKNDGTVFAWGYSDESTTNVPAGLSDVQSIDVAGYSSWAVKTDGTVVAWGRNEYGVVSVPVEAQSNVAAISGNLYHAAVLKTDGTVVAWGRNDGGQATVPPDLSDVQAISTGSFHTAALKSDGSVVAWGSAGSLPPAAQSGVVAIATGYLFTVALKSDGSVIAWGDNADGVTNVPAAAESGVVAIQAGASHALALKNDGTLVAWGANDDGLSTVPGGAIGVRAFKAGLQHDLATVAPTVSFSEQNLGTSSAAKTFSINNTGDAALGLASVTVIGAHAGDFTVDTASTASSVPATGTTTFNVTFTPSAGGVRTATLRVVSDDPNEGTYDIALGGTGVGSEIHVFDGWTTSPLLERTHDVGTVAVGDTATGAESLPQNFTIKNTGAVDLTGLVVNSTSDQFIITQPLVSPLAPTAITTFTVTFRPTSAGKKVTVLTISSNATNHGSFIINMDGDAYTPATPIFFFTNGLKTIELDPRTTATGGRTVTDVIGQPASGTVTLVNGKLRYVPKSATPSADDIFTYLYESGTGDLALGEVRIRNVSSAAGDYDGIVEQPGVTPGAEDFDRSGLLKVTVAKTGAITGKLQLAGGTVRAFSGSFAGGTGTVRVKVARAPMAPIDLTLIYDPIAGVITGTAASFDNLRNPINAVFSLEPRAAAGARTGAYTMFIAPDGTVDSPQGTSFACVKIKSDGFVTLVGKLADGSLFSSGTGLHAQQTFGFYTGLYPGDRTMQGSVRGTMNFPSATAPGSPVATALALWYKPYRPLDRYFPYGFALSRNSDLYTYTRPAAGTRILALANVANNGQIIVDHGTQNGFVANFTLPRTNLPTVSLPNPAKIALKFDPATGFFVGGFTHPVSNARLTFYGAVCQPRTGGDGFFLATGPTDGCSVQILATPAG